MHNTVTEDYRKLEVNKLYHIALSDGCMCFKVGEKAVNTNWSRPADHSRWQGARCMCEYVTGYKLTVDMGQTFK
jgi:hypothetical protein